MFGQNCQVHLIIKTKTKNKRKPQNDQSMKNRIYWLEYRNKLISFRYSCIRAQLRSSGIYMLFSVPPPLVVAKSSQQFPVYVLSA